jgi:hypothetical protein
MGIEPHWVMIDQDVPPGSETVTTSIPDGSGGRRALPVPKRWRHTSFNRSQAPQIGLLRSHPFLRFLQVKHPARDLVCLGMGLGLGLRSKLAR